MKRKAKEYMTIEQIEANKVHEFNIKLRGFLNHHAVRDWYQNSDDCFGKHFDRRSGTCRSKCGVNLLCEFYANCKDEYRKHWGFTEE